MRKSGLPPTAGDEQGPARRATIQDVAAAAGVSISAVSKVVRDAYGVSPQMRERVTAAIEQLGYRPNAGARAMRGRSYTIGVVLVELTSPFQPEVAQGVSDELEAGPFQEIIVTAGSAAKHAKTRIQALLDRQVDGLVVVAPWIEVDWIEDLAQRLPVVTVALHGPARHFDTVVDDEHLGAGLMVDHLVGLGHRRIAHTSMPAGVTRRPFALSHTARADGYRQAMRRHGLEPEIITTQYSEDGGYEAAAKLLAQPEPPTAIFAGADIAALGVMRAAEERGLRIPDDLTVAGYDNIHISTINRVSLTTVDQSGHLTGSVSARLLLERIAGRTQPVRYVVSPSLVARATSGPPPSATVPASRHSTAQTKSIVV
ncbi:LacI family DNA-binding transcriptional regulator [Kineococcus sp. R86509]|uniref:LacI family DNA-binding transcriptional regulator n=1 Tax=Kineococcus sp. R86509 TaxID=3093851 RepID=UPI0036D24DC6